MQEATRILHPVSCILLDLLAGSDQVAKFSLGQCSFLCHQLGILVVFDKGDKAADAGFAIHKAPREAANRRALIEQQVNVAARTFQVNDVIREHFNVHQLILVRRE